MLDDAEDAFGGYAHCGLDYEEGFDPTPHNADVIHLFAEEGEDDDEVEDEEPPI